MSKGLIQDGDVSLTRGQSLVHEKGEVFCAAVFGLAKFRQVQEEAPTHNTGVPIVGNSCYFLFKF